MELEHELVAVVVNDDAVEHALQETGAKSLCVQVFRRIESHDLEEGAQPRILDLGLVPVVGFGARALRLGSPFRGRRFFRRPGARACVICGQLGLDSFDLSCQCCGQITVSGEGRSAVPVGAPVAVPFSARVAHFADELATQLLELRLASDQVLFEDGSLFGGEDGGVLAADDGVVMTGQCQLPLKLGVSGQLAHGTEDGVLE